MWLVSLHSSIKGNSILCKILVFVIFTHLTIYASVITCLTISHVVWTTKETVNNLVLYIQEIQAVAVYYRVYSLIHLLRPPFGLPKIGLINEVVLISNIKS